MTHTTDDLMALDLEYRLTTGYRLRLRCECAPYFIRRREVLIPEVLKEAARRDIDAVDLFVAYARGVHARHESGLTLSVRKAAA